MDIMLLKVSSSFFQRLQFLRWNDNGQSFTKQRIVVWLTPFAFDCEW